MKKVLSIFLSLSMILSSVSQNICLADPSAEQVKGYQEVAKIKTKGFDKKGKKIFKSKRDFISQKGKKAFKSKKKFIFKNSSTFIAAIAGFTLSVLSVTNGMKNFPKIKEIFVNSNITINQKLTNLIKVLFGVTVKTEVTKNASEFVNSDSGNTITENERISNINIASDTFNIINLNPTEPFDKGTNVEKKLGGTAELSTNIKNGISNENAETLLEPEVTYLNKVNDIENLRETQRKTSLEAQSTEDSQAKQYEQVWDQNLSETVVSTDAQTNTTAKQDTVESDTNQTNLIKEDQLKIVGLDDSSNFNETLQNNNLNATEKELNKSQTNETIESYYITYQDEKKEQDFTWVVILFLFVLALFPYFTDPNSIFDARNSRNEINNLGQKVVRPKGNFYLRYRYLVAKRKHELMQQSKNQIEDADMPTT